MVERADERDEHARLRDRGPSDPCRLQWFGWSSASMSETIVTISKVAASVLRGGRDRAALRVRSREKRTRANRSSADLFRAPARDTARSQALKLYAIGRVK